MGGGALEAGEVQAADVLRLEGVGEVRGRRGFPADVAVPEDHAVRVPHMDGGDRAGLELRQDGGRAVVPGAAGMARPMSEG